MGRFFIHTEASWWSMAFLIFFFVSFLSLVFYWYNPRKKGDCEEFAAIPLKED